MLDPVDYMTRQTLLDLQALHFDSTEEFRLSAKYTAQLTWNAHPLTTVRNKPNILPKRPGIYVIHKNSTPHYVGISTSSLRYRFDNRLRVFKELGVSDHEFNVRYANRQLVWATIVVSRQSSSGVIKRKGKRARTYPRKPLPHTTGVLQVIEQHLIDQLGTAGKGNRAQEPFHFIRSGEINFSHINMKPGSQAINQIIRKLTKPLK